MYLKNALENLLYNNFSQIYKLLFRYFCHRSGMIIFNNLILLKNILYILQNYLYKFVLLLMNYRFNLYIKVYRNAINLYRNFMEINFMEINFC